MARGRSGGSGSLLNNFGFGVFSVNTCDSEDQSWYCQLSRMFSTILMIFVILCIIYYIFNFIKYNFSFKKIKKFKKFKK